MSTAVIIGASKGLGKAIAYELAAKGINIILSARNEKELEAIASDISAKYKLTPAILPVDLEKLNTDTAAGFVKDCFNKFNDITRVYITAAIADNNDAGLDTIDVLQQTNDINYRGSALLITCFSEKLQNTSSVISVMSSIAAIRPRGRNISYAASKIALEYHVLGLRHHLAVTSLRLQVYRIGYMDTDMAAGTNPPLFKKENPARVAKYIIGKSNAGGGLYYYPRFWRLVAMALKCVPWFIYKKLRF
jgi:short-subunit dehydrogenase